MTERDELVERTARAIASELTAQVHATQPDDIPVSYIEAVSENYRGAARAAIAECEQKWKEDQHLRNERADKLEIELADEKLLREAQEAALNRCCAARRSLDAEAAAMRTALDINNCWLEASLTCESHVWDSDQREAADHCLQKGKEALSLDAGRKVLDVVKAAQELNAWRIVVNTESARGRWHYRIEMGPSERHLDDALSALGWKP